MYEAILIDLTILLALVWLPIFAYQITTRPWRLFIVWLFLAPVVTPLVARISSGNTLFQASVTPERRLTEEQKRDAYFAAPTTITLHELAEPTRILFGLLFTVYLHGGLLQNKRLLPLDRTERWMSAFSIIIIVNVLFKAWRIAYGLHIAIDAFVVPFLGYYLARRLVTYEERFRQFVQCLGYLGCYLIVMGVHERLTQPELVHRIGGPFASRDSLYIVMAVVFFAVLSDSISSKGVPKEQQALSGSVQRFVLYLAPVIIVLTLTRGNWLGFLSGVWTLLFLGRRFIYSSRRLGTIGLIFLLIPVVVISLQVLTPKEIFKDRIEQDQNIHGRLATWIATIQLSGRAPVLGLGLHNLVGALYETRVQVGRVKNMFSPHNSLLSTYVELGAVGLLAYLGIAVSIVQMGLRLYATGGHVRDRWRGIAVVSIMVAYQTSAFFTNLFYAPGLIQVYVYVFMGAIAGLYGRSRLARDL